MAHFVIAAVKLHIGEIANLTDLFDLRALKQVGDLARVACILFKRFIK